MFAKTIALLAFVAATQAIHSGGVYDNTLALGTQSESTFRGFGGLSSVSKQAKAIDSAYASVRKYDSRVTNDAALVARPVGYAGYASPAYAAAPALAHGYAAPAVAYGHGPAVAYGHGPAIAHGYAGPALAHGYAAPALAHGYAAPALAHGYAAPALAHGYAAPVGVAKAVHGLGVAYSPAAAVATHSFNGFGISYGY